MLAVIVAAVVDYLERTFVCWLVVQVAKGQTHRAAQCVPMCRIGVSSWLGCQVMIRKAWPWTIVGTMFGGCHAPCTLNTCFLDF